MIIQSNRTPFLLKIFGDKKQIGYLIDKIFKNNSYQKRMGNTQNWVTADASFPTEQELLNNLIPIDDAENDNPMLSLGRFKIYRFKIEPYEIVMKHVRTFTPNNPKFKQYEEAVCTVTAKLQHKNIAKIHSVNICKRSSICIQQVAIESYVNYYALDLQKVIDQRKIKDCRFTTGQLWYIIKSLVDLALYLKRLDIYFGIYTPRNICLSPQGYIKVYLHHCTPKNNHFLYYHLIGHEAREMYKFLPLPPECLPFLKKRAQSIEELDREKMDCFGIGAIALEAMLYHSTRRYYLDEGQSQLSLRFDKKQFQVDFLELKQVYPENLLNLVQSLTKIQASERMSLSQAQAYIQSVRESISISGSIKLMEDEQDTTTPHLSYKCTSKDCRQILKSITSKQNKLQFFPLKTVTKQHNHRKSDYRPLHVSQAQSKQNKLQLSTFSLAKTVNRKHQHNQRGLLTSFRC